MTKSPAEFTLSFATVNAVFEDDWAGATAAILALVAQRVHHGDRDGVIRDSNGNTIGRFKGE